MQCDCEVAVDGKRFAKLCKEHHDMKVRAMTRERLYCHNVVEALLISEHRNVSRETRVV